MAVPVAVQSNFAATAALIERPAHVLATTFGFLSCAIAALDAVAAFPHVARDLKAVADAALL